MESKRQKEKEAAVEGEVGRSFIHSFTDLFIHSFIHSSYIHALVHPSIHPLIYSFNHLFIPLLIQTTHPPIQVTRRRSPFVEVLVATIGAGMLPHRMRLAKLLWEAGIPAEYLPQENPKLKKQVGKPTHPPTHPPTSLHTWDVSHPPTHLLHTDGACARERHSFPSHCRRRREEEGGG